MLIFLPLDQKQAKLYKTLAMQAVHSYLDFPDDIVLKGDANARNIEYGPLNISTYGKTNTFLINYAGPPSGIMVSQQNRASE